MKRRLQQELGMSRPFGSLEEEVFLEIVRTSQVTSRWVFEALKGSELTPQQFNVLRILRGAGTALPSGKIAERMIDHDPDLTRLLDRLEKRGLVEKARDTKDRRVVNASITKTGLALVEAATGDVRDRLKHGMRPVGRTDLEQLADLLESV